MSHFTVMVIGDNAEEQLAPYDESISVKRYTEGPVSDEEKESFRQHYITEKGASAEDSFEKLYAEYGNDWNGGSWKFIDGQWMETSTYNPESKWDWYVLGGRWSGAYIKLKQGAEAVGVGRSGVFGNETGVDSAYKGDIDFDGIRKEAEDEAGQKWDEVHQGLHNYLQDNYESAISEYTEWDKVREEMFPGELEKAREYYHAQELVKAFAEVNKDGKYSGFMGDGVLPYLHTREVYVRKAGDRSFSTYAIVKDGQWYEKGKMGWFGMSSDEMSEDEWNQKVWEMINGLSDDTLISIYDCHI